MKFIDGDLFESISDFSFGDIYTKQIRPTPEILFNVKKNLHRPPIFYIETSRTVDLLDAISKVGFDCFIITHNSDSSISPDFDNFPKNVIKIFSQNYTGDHPLVDPIPIGLERKMWFPERNKQEKIANIQNKPNRKIKLFHCNFSLKTNYKRKIWFDSINRNGDIQMGSNESGGFDEYINELSESKFVISPPGNGVDCHRNWEALYCGSVPVIEDNPFNRKVFKNLPHILIDDISKIYDIMEENRDTEYNFNTPELWGEYWEQKIKNF